MTLDFERIRLAMPCATLVKGSNGVEQPRQVRNRILDLERAGLIEHMEKRGKIGWYLTTRGEAEAAWVRSQARRQDRKGA
jgi:hypothetical protein